MDQNDRISTFVFSTEDGAFYLKSSAPENWKGEGFVEINLANLSIDDQIDETISLEKIRTIVYDIPDYTLTKKLYIEDDKGQVVASTGPFNSEPLIHRIQYHNDVLDPYPQYSRSELFEVKFEEMIDIINWVRPCGKKVDDMIQYFPVEGINSFGPYSSAFPQKRELVVKVFGLKEKFGELLLLLNQASVISSIVEESHRISLYKLAAELYKSYRFGISLNLEELIANENRASYWSNSMICHDFVIEKNMEIFEGDFFQNFKKLYPFSNLTAPQSY